MKMHASVAGVLLGFIHLLAGTGAAEFSVPDQALRQLKSAARELRGAPVEVTYNYAVYTFIGEDDPVEASEDGTLWTRSSSHLVNGEPARIRVVLLPGHSVPCIQETGKFEVLEFDGRKTLEYRSVQRESVMRVVHDGKDSLVEFGAPDTGAGALRSDVVRGRDASPMHYSPVDYLQKAANLIESGAFTPTVLEDGTLRLRLDGGDEYWTEVDYAPRATPFLQRIESFADTGGTRTEVYTSPAEVRGVALPTGCRIEDRDAEGRLVSIMEFSGIQYRVAGEPPPPETFRVSRNDTDPSLRGSERVLIDR